MQNFEYRIEAESLKGFFFTPGGSLRNRLEVLPYVDFVLSAKMPTMWEKCRNQKEFSLYQLFGQSPADGRGRSLRTREAAAKPSKFNKNTL